MKIALVAHRSSGFKIKDVIRTKFPYVEVLYYPYDLPQELPEMFAKLNKRSFDYYMFSSILPFLRCPQYMLPHIPYIIINHNEDEVFQALLKAKLADYDFNNISFDLYPWEIVPQAYEEAHLSYKDIFSYKHDLNMPAVELNQAMVDFHIRNVRFRGAKLVISDFSTVTRELEKMGIPSIKLNPTRRSIGETVYKLLLRHREHENNDNQNAVVAIKLCMKSNLTFSNINENQFAIRKLQLAPEIYRFAQNIHGTVVELSSLNYLIFANHKLLDEELSDHKKIDLLRIPADNIFSHIAIGVGYSESIDEAKANAIKGLQKSEAMKKSVLYLVTPKTIEGPFSVVETAEQNPINAKLLEIAHNTNISLELLQSIEHALDVRDNTFFTSKDLAEITNNNFRQMDRVIKKLINAGYAKVITKQGQQGAGRPSRIIEILLDRNHI